MTDSPSPGSGARPGVTGTPAGRKPAVEALRVIAAFGIIWYHGGIATGRYVGYAGLIAFVVVTAFYEAGRRAPAVMATTARRLIVPWLFWTLLYGLVNAVQHDPVFVAGDPRGGTSPHLWYLPFILVVIWLIRTARRYAAYPALFGFGVFVLTAAAWRQYSMTLGTPWTQWIHAAPAVLFGIVLAQPGARWMILAGVCIGTTATLTSITGVGIPYTVGCAAAAWALTSRGAGVRDTTITRLASLTFGIYLVHPLFLSALRLAGIGGVARIGLAFACSAAGVFVMRQTAFGRRIT